MQIHQIKPNHKSLRPKRVGRGGKRGTYSGRGMKGQKSRAGAKIRPQIREAVLKFPKKRGFKFKSRNPHYIIVSLSDLRKTFPQGGIITPAKLEKKGLISGKKRRERIKILGVCPLKAKYTLKRCWASKVAGEEIIKAGGKIISSK